MMFGRPFAFDGGATDAAPAVGVGATLGATPAVGCWFGSDLQLASTSRIANEARTPEEYASYLAMKTPFRSSVAEMYVLPVPPVFLSRQDIARNW